MNQFKRRAYDLAEFNSFVDRFSDKATEKEQISFCYQIIEDGNLFTLSPSASKGETLASKYRADGNELFKKGDYKGALKLYTQSVAYTPYDDPKEEQMLALALSNRSAALFHLKAYKQCLTEIDNAIQAGYPGGLQYKLHDRKGKCYLALNLLSPAKTAFNKAISFLEITTLEKTKKDDVRQSLMKRLNDCDTETAIPNDVKNPNPMSKVYTVPVLETTNSMYPSLTSACDVKYSPSKGRYFEANRYIAAGEVILVEEPYVANLALDNCLDHCHHCFKQALAPIVCRKCPFGLYCSNACRDISWESYHKYECAIDFTDDVDYQHTVIVYRMILIARNDIIHNYCKGRISKAVENGNGELTVCNDDGLYISTDYNAAHHLLNHSAKVKKLRFFQYCLQAVYLMKCLEKSSFFTAIPDLELEEFKLYIVKELWQGFNMANVNSVSILGQTFEPPFLNSIAKGGGIYTTGSLQNHACNNNTFSAFYGKHQIVRSWWPIAKGQEVTTSYYGDYYHILKHDRQQFLKQYQFECNCNACINDWPLLKDMADAAEVLKCRNLPALMEYYRTFEEMQKKVRSGDIAGALLDTLELIKLIDDLVVSSPLKLKLVCQDTVKNINDLMAYCYTCPEPVIDYFEACVLKNRI